MDYYYDGGTVRLNTKFYSWDTSFGLVHPRLRYSCLQVVFCVNLGTFCKCFLQLGWRLKGVRSTQTEASLNVPWMFPEYSPTSTSIPKDMWTHIYLEAAERFSNSFITMASVYGANPTDGAGGWGRRRLAQGNPQGMYTTRLSTILSTILSWVCICATLKTLNPKP